MGALLRQVAMTEHAVVIAGGGPTGLMLAGELALAGVDVVIVERRANQDVDGSRAGGLLSRTIEVLDQRGIAERFLSAGQVIPAQGFAGIPLDISDFPTRHNYVLALWQSQFEPILADWVGELGVPILRGREVVGFAQDDTGVDVELSGGHVAPGGVSRRLRRRTQPGPQGSRHRLRRVGSLDQLDDRRGRDGRGAGARHAPRQRRRHRPRSAADGEPVRVVLTERARRTHRRPQHGRAPRGTRRRVRDGLRAAQRQLDLPVHRHDAAGGLLPPRPCPAGRGRRTRASPAGRPGPQHRRAGCREPGMEAGPGGQQDITREPPRHLPRRTASGRCPGVAQHHGASRAQPAPTTVTRPSATP